MSRLDPAAMVIAAPFVNQFQIVRIGGTVRIAFAEGFRGEPSNYRSAVSMSYADARTLADSLSDDMIQNETGAKVQTALQTGPAA